MRMNRSVSNSTIRSTRWIRPRSMSAFLFVHGHPLSALVAPSRCIRSSTCAAAFPPSSTLPTAVHDVFALDRIAFEAGAFYVMDRGYLSFKRLLRIHESGAFFVTRALKTTRLGRQSSRPVSRETGVRSDQTVLPTGVTTRDDY